MKGERENSRRNIYGKLYLDFLVDQLYEISSPRSPQLIKIKKKNAKQGKFHPTDTSLNRLDSRSSCSHIQHNPDSVLSSVFDGLVEHNMHAVCEDC